MMLKAKIEPKYLDMILSHDKKIELRQIEGVELTDGKRTHTFMVRNLNQLDRSTSDILAGAFPNFFPDGYDPIVSFEVGKEINKEEKEEEPKQKPKKKRKYKKRRAKKKAKPSKRGKSVTRYFCPIPGCDHSTLYARALENHVSKEHPGQVLEFKNKGIDSTAKKVQEEDHP